MEGQIVNNFSYSGVMTVTLDGQVTSFKNRGTRELGIVITKALAGYPIDNEVPRCFSIEEKDSDGSWINLLNRRLPFTGITYDITETEEPCIGKLNLNCVILSNDKKKDSTDGKLRFCVYSMYGSNPLAIVENTELNNIFNNITDGTDCVVRWKMCFYNK